MATVLQTIWAAPLLGAATQPLLWALLVAAIAGDQLTTAYGIRRYGPRIEANPLMRAVWVRWGAPGILLLQCALLFPVLAIAQIYSPDFAFLVPLLVFGAAANNIRVIVVKARRRRRKAAMRLQASGGRGSETAATGE